MTIIIKLLGNYLDASPRILMKLGLFDTLLRETKESGRETCRFAT